MILNQTAHGSLTYTVTRSRRCNARPRQSTAAYTSSQTPGPGRTGLGATSVTERDPRDRTHPQSTDWQLLSPTDVAHAYKLNRKTIYRAIERGELRASRLGNRLRIRPDDCQTWLDSNTVPNKAPRDVPINPTTSPPRRQIRDLLETDRS